MNRPLAAIAAGLVLAGALHAQRPVPPCLPAAGPSPLLFVRFSGPDGLQTTFYQGNARPRSFPAPAVVGMRPGYVYRVQLSNLPGRPAVNLFPSIEVRGSLKLQPRHGAHLFPATIHLSEQDLDAAAMGSMITKVIYLEHPDRADPVPTKDGEIRESEIPPGRDLEVEARQKGRIVLMIHLGERVPTMHELAMTNVPGTILMPGEKVVGPAAAPPCLFGHSGSRPLDEETIHDGGDRLYPAGFDAGGRLGGVDPEDTVAEYRDSAGRRQIVASNRVCLCAPRFFALRKECPIGFTESAYGPLHRTLVKSGLLIESREPSVMLKKADQLRQFDGRVRPSVNLGIDRLGHYTALKVLSAQTLDLGPLEAIGTKRILTLTEKAKAEAIQQFKVVKQFSTVVNLAGVEQIEGTAVIARYKDGPEVISATVQTRDLTVCCCETPIPPEKPLVLVKCADKSCVNPGDVVTFTLRYSNVGGRPMTDVAVVDSLSPRLEYVPDSAQADRDAVFTVQPNEAGAQLLRWEITGTLLPGQSGRIRFQAKVR